MNEVPHNDQTLFTETQKSHRFFIGSMLVVVGVLLMFFIGRLVRYGFQAAVDAVSAGPFFTSIILVLILLLLFKTIYLHTRITRDSISVKLSPFHSSYEIFKIENIAHAYIRKYAPLKEYGGWGIRQNWKGTSKAYNIKGKTGLQLELKNGKKVLIGTQKGAELAQVIATHFPHLQA